MEVDPPTHPGTDVGRRLTTREVRQHPSAVPSEGPGGGGDFPMGDFGANDSIRNINVFGGGAASELGTAMALLGSINNPLSNQI